jgi:hypothetical protein
MRVLSRVYNYAEMGIRCAVFVLLGGLCLWAAEPSLLDLAPPESDLLVGLSLENIRGTDLGQFLLLQVKPDNPQFKAFVAKAGFDPLRDVDEILLAAPAKGGKSRGLLLARGAFDATRFAELAVEPGTSTSAYRGVQILTRQEGQDEPLATALLSPSLIAGGDPESVRAAIERRRQNQRLQPRLAVKAADMALANDFWLVLNAPPTEFTGGTSPLETGAMADLVQSVEQASAGVKFGTDLLVSADIQTRTPKDAAGLAAALRLFIGLAASSQRDAKQAGAILEKLKLRAEGNAVRLWMSVPEAEIASSIRAALTEAAKPKPAEGQQAQAPPPEPEGVTIYSSPKDMGTVTIK